MLRQGQPKKKPSHPSLPPPRGALSSSSASSSARIPPDVNLDADNNDNSYYVRELKQWDVLLGRGTGPNEHIGNKYYRDVIEAQTEAYFAGTTNRNERMKIIQGTIHHIIHDKKGRFLKRLEKHEIRQLGLSTTASAGEGIYCLADSISQCEKTKQAFRYANKKGITNHDGPPPKDNDEDDDNEEEEQEESHNKRKVAVSVIQHRTKNVTSSRNKRDVPQSCHTSGDTLTRYPVQKKARKEDGPAAMTKSSSSSSSSSSSLRAIPPPPPIVSPTMNVETALLDLPALINSGGVGGRGGSNQASFLLQTLFAAPPPSVRTTTAVGGGSLLDFATAATTTRRITPPAAYPSSFVESQQHMLSHHQQSSTTRRFGSGIPPLVTLEDLLTPRRNVQVHDIANAISAEAVLQSIMTRRRFAAIPPPRPREQSEMMISRLLVPQHRYINAAPATTTGTTGRNLLNNTSNNPSTQRGFYAALELAELVATTKDDNHLPRGGGGGR